MPPTKRDVHLQIIEQRGSLENRFGPLKRVGRDGGGGHFSLVFTAVDQVEGTDVIVKVFNPERLSPQDAYRWNCFERESKVLSRLQGQRDVIQLVSPQAHFIESLPTPIAGLNYDISFSYYVMEKAEFDVSEAIFDQRWNALESLTQFHRMVRAVQRIHSLGLSHRDLKPDNFLVTGAGLKLSDFGTARFLDGSEQALKPSYDHPPGDLRYTAPELFACLHDATPEIAFKADIFSLGAILFELFTGIKLCNVLFGANLLRDVTAHLAPVNSNQRMDVYKQVVDSIARAHPLPAMAAINPNVPKAIRDRLDALYRGLCKLDFRDRNCHYPSIFRQIETCILILRNEVAYQRWQAERQRYRSARLSRKAINHDHDRH